jgi:hypothetical protein
VIARERGADLEGGERAHRGGLGVRGSQKPLCRRDACLSVGVPDMGPVMGTWPPTVPTHDWEQGRHSHPPYADTSHSPLSATDRPHPSHSESRSSITITSVCLHGYPARFTANRLLSTDPCHPRTLHRNGCRCRGRRARGEGGHRTCPSWPHLLHIHAGISRHGFRPLHQGPNDFRPALHPRRVVSRRSRR